MSTTWILTSDSTLEMYSRTIMSGFNGKGEMTVHNACVELGTVFTSDILEIG